MASNASPVGSSVPSGPRPLILLDGMSLAFRAYFALPTTLTTSQGVVTNAVHGFASMVVNLIRDHRPGALAVAFDLPGGTFRDDMVGDYKGGRAETPPDLPPQFDMIRAMLESLAIPVVSAPGFEADDVLATLATEARDRGQDVIIVTGDRDSYQLVEDPHVRVLYNKRGVSDYALYDEAGIVERTGVTPSLYPILAALRGDPSDNLPGVPGVGEKTAAKLVNEYGDLDTLYAHLDALSPKLRENLANSLERVRINAEVIPLVRNVPLGVHVDDLKLGGWKAEEARSVFGALELRSLWTRFSGLMKDGALGAGDAGGVDLGSQGSPAAPPPAVVNEAADEVPLLDEVPDWLGQPVVLRPTGVGDILRDLGVLLDTVRQLDGWVALVARWEGDPGRSPLSRLGLGVGWHAAGSDISPVSPVVMLTGTDLADEAVIDGLRGFFTPGLPAVVGHDVKEIMRSLLALGLDARELGMDTAVAAYLLDPSTDHYRLGELARRYLGVALETPVAAPTQGSFALDDGDDDGTLPAADLRLVEEVAVVGRLAPLLLPALAEVGEGELFSTVERPLVRVLARMESVGIAVDVAVLRSIASELTERCRSLESELHELAGGPFNVNSVPQLREVLYERLGLTPIRKTKTGFSTDARTLEQLRDQHPIVDVLLRYREVEKLRSTYGDNLAAEVAADGRIHATFRQTVARTGRLSSDQPNLHNIPVRTDDGRRFREAFVPSPGRTLLVADYDQVELRAIAHLSGDPGLTSAFAAGEDIHRTVAARVFGIERDAVTSEQRTVAKMVSYGLAYGMEAYGLAQRLAVPVDEAQAILQAFFAAFPEVHHYMDEAVDQARAVGYTVTTFGRRRPLPDLKASNYQVRQAAERQAMNAGIQGLAADLFKIALVRLDEALESGNFSSDLVLQVHDEVILDVEPGEEEAVEALTETCLTEAASLRVPLKVAMAWGSSWAEAKGS